MTFKKYQTANNAKAQLDVGISASITSLIVKSGFGALFPAHNGTTDKDYSLTVVKFDTDGVTVLKREIVLVTARVGDTFSITRSAGTCPGSDTATTQGTTAYAFDADDYVFLNNTAELIKDIQNETTRIVAVDVAGLETNKLSKAEYQAGTYVYGASSGGTDAYAVTLPISPGAYAVGQVFKFLADVINTGPATLNINGLGAKTIKKLHDQDLATGDIEAGQIVEVAYDGTNFQMNSQIATIAEAETAKLQEQLIVVGESGNAGESLFVEQETTFALATTAQNIGDVTANKRVSRPIFGSGTRSNAIKLALKKSGTPTNNLIVRIETDNAGSPSGTLIDAVATATILPANLTTSFADTEILMGTNFADGHAVALNTNETGQTYQKGVKFTLTSQVGLVSVTKVSECTATKAYLYNSAGTLLATATFSGNTATFNYTGVISGSTYYVTTGSDGSSYTSVKQTGSAAYPYVKSKLNFVGGGYFIAPVTTTSDCSVSGTNPGGRTNTITFTMTETRKLTSAGATSGPSGNSVLKTAGGTVIETASGSTFSGNTTLVSGTTYILERSSSGVSALVGTTKPTFPQVKTNMTFTDQTNGDEYMNIGITVASALVDNTDIYNIETITSIDGFSIPSGTKAHVVVNQNGDAVDASNYYVIGYYTNDTSIRGLKLWGGSSRSAMATAKWIYAYSTMFLGYILGKTNATYSYKMPTDYVRIAKETYTEGLTPKIILPMSITNAIPSVTANASLFLGNTPGSISSTPGTNKFYVGKVLPDGINTWLNSKNLLTGTQTPGASPYTYQNTTGFPIIVTITGGTVSAIALSRDGTNFFQVGSATNNQVILQPLDYVKVTYSSAPTMTIFYQ